MPLDQRGRIIDFLGTLASFTTALGVANPGTLGGNTAGFFDTGGGRTSGDLTVDVSYASLGSFSINTALEYQIFLQGSNSSSFATPVVDLAMVSVGPCNNKVAGKLNKGGGLLQPSSTRNLATVPVRASAPFSNDYGGTIYRYLRTWSVSWGTIATGIIYKAYLTKSLY